MLKLIILMTFLALTSCRGIVSRGRNPVTERIAPEQVIEEIVKEEMDPQYVLPFIDADKQPCTVWDVPKKEE